MIRLAIVVTDRKIWTGGYNYLLNLVNVASTYLGGQIVPVVFFSDDAPEEDVAPFAIVSSAEIVRSRALRQSRRARAVMNALFWGVDPSIRDLFEKNHIDVVLEVAQFFGWRLPQPAIAWMADFQHRLMKHLFSKRAYWRRELGFRAEIVSGRSVILSSEDARSQCQRFYPMTRGRTYVLQFAVAARSRIAPAEMHRIMAIYALPTHFYFLPNQFWRHKNHECVIRAIGRLTAAGYRVVVAASGNPLDRGDPHHWPRLERLIEDLKVGANFRLLGMIPRDHVYALMQSCTALINPSLSEGWSTTVEEAKSAGTPMILSDLAVHHEQANGLATFFDPKDDKALAEILQSYLRLDTDIRAKMAERAALSSDEAVWRYADNLLRVIADVSGGTSNRR
jgi:glycosyltransferase involved in cell wall biosynthesis